MSDNDAFNQESSQDPSGQQSAAPVSAEQTNSEFVGEGKKYANVDEAIRSIAPAQEHISNLEKELGELREEVTKRSAAEEILSRIDASKLNQDTPASGLDKEAVAQLVNETVSNLDSVKIANANKALVNDKLATLYKDRAGEAVSIKAKELGVSIEYLQATAEQSPKAFYQMLGIADESSQSKSESMNFNSDVGTEGFKNNQSGSIQYGTYKYFQNLRKENPSKYYTIEVQRDLHKNAKELGDKFYK